MKEQETVAEAAYADALSGNKHKTTSENDSCDPGDQHEHHPNKDPCTASADRTHPRSTVRAQNDKAPPMSVSTTNHVTTSSNIQQDLNNLYTKLKTRILSVKHREPSFSSPEPATFKMVDELIVELFQILEDHELTFSHCYMLLGIKDHIYPLTSHIINLLKSKQDLEKDVKTKEQQKNKWADHISKLENRCRNQTTEINHLNEEVRKLKEEMEKLKQISNKRDDKQKIKMEKQSLKLESPILKTENLTKRQKVEEDANPIVENSQGSISTPNNDEKNNNQRAQNSHVYVQSLPNIQVQASKGEDSKETDSTDKSKYLFNQSGEKSQKGSSEHLVVTDTDGKSKLTRSKERDQQDLDFRSSNSHNELYGQKHSPSKIRSNKRIAFPYKKTGTFNSKDYVVEIKTFKESGDNENNDLSSSRTHISNSDNQQGPIKCDTAITRGWPRGKKYAKNSSTKRCSVARNNLQQSSNLSKIKKGQTPRTK